MNYKLLLMTAFAFFLASITRLSAQGDNCTDAIDLGVLTSPQTYSTAGKSVDFGSYTSETWESPDMAFYIDIPAGKQLIISQTNDYDSKFMIRTGGACPGTTEEAYVDDPDDSTIYFTNITASSVRVYWIQGGYNGEEGSFTLSWSVADPIVDEPFIYDASWISSVNNDGDYYARSAVLKFNPDFRLATSSASVYGKIYYKLSTSSSYSYLGQSETGIISGKSTGDYLTYDVSNLPEGVYDFKIELYSSGGKLFDETCDTTDDSLDDIAFEPVSRDVVLPVIFASGSYIGSTVDSDADGYAQSGVLTFDPDIANGDTTVYGKIYYKLSTASSYDYLGTTASEIISGESSDDTIMYSISNLPYGIYDVKIELYVNDSTLADTLIIDNQKFELASTDQGTVTPTTGITSASWPYMVDNDGDTYARGRTLRIDPDIASGSTTGQINVYYKLSTSTAYTFLGSSVESTITAGSSSDYIVYFLEGLSHSLYDIKVDLMEGGVLVDSYTESDDADLKDVGFELSSEDVATTALPAIYGVSWASQVDNDGDYYTQSRELQIDADIESGSAAVYSKVYYKLASSTNYTLLGTTSTKTISGQSTSDYMSYQVSDLPKGTYDFKIELYNSSNALLETYASDYDSNLKDETFEPISEDGSSSGTHTIFNVSWSDVVDNDGDTYTQSRSLNFYTNNTLATAQTVYAKVYYKSSSTITYTALGTTPSFTVASSTYSATQKFTVSGLSSTGSYDFQIELYNSNNALIDTYNYTTDGDQNVNNQNFEPAAGDLATGNQPVVSSVAWLNIVDVDADGYSQSRVLSIDPDFTSVKTVYALVYYKIATASTYTLLGQTAATTIVVSSSSDAISYDVAGLAAGLYDFKVELYSNDGTLIDNYSDIDDDNLDDEKFENAGSDSNPNDYPTITTSWSSLNAADADLDNYFERVTLLVDVSSSVTLGAIKANVSYKKTTESTYTLYTTRDTTLASGSSEMKFLVTGFSKNSYDFRVELVDASNTVVAYSNLASVKLEGGTTASGVEGNIAPNMYPNPVVDVLNIQLPGDNHGTLTICDILGKKVLEKEISGQLVHEKLDELHGLYLVTVTTPQGVITKLVTVK